MLKILNSWLSSAKKKTNIISKYFQQNKIFYKLRVISFDKDETDNYKVLVQLVNKNKTFLMSPQDILADDYLTDLFSPRDIRTLTYLGYLGINTPQYKILAKHWSETDNGLMFALKKKGAKTHVVKTAKEIFSDKCFIKNLCQEDALMIGYVSAIEQNQKDKNQIQKLKNKNKK